MEYGIAMKDINKGEWISSNDVNFRPTEQQLAEHGDYQSILELNKKYKDELERIKALSLEKSNEILKYKQKIERIKECVDVEFESVNI